MYSGGLWWWPSRPCEWPAKRLRGRPVSRTVTLRRARPSCRAPARPAKLPPMMMTSSMVISSVLWIEQVARIAAISCGGPHDARQNGLVQPARRCLREHHEGLVRPAGHDADAPGLQRANPGSHHGSRLHHQELQRGRDLLLRCCGEPGVRHARAKHRHGDAVAFEFEMKGLAKT